MAEWKMYVVPAKITVEADSPAHAMRLVTQALAGLVDYIEDVQFGEAVPEPDQS